MPDRLSVEYCPFIRKVETFTFGELAPIFKDASQSAGNVVVPVGVGEQDKKLIGAVLRNDIAAPQCVMQTFNKFFARVLERNFFAVIRPL